MMILVTANSTAVRVYLAKRKPALDPETEGLRAFHCDSIHEYPASQFRDALSYAQGLGSRYGADVRVLKQKYIYKFTDLSEYFPDDHDRL